MQDDLTKDDEIVNVQLPLRDYRQLRELLDERQAMAGMKKLVQKAFWLAAGLLSILGVVEILKQLNWKL